RRAPVGGEDAVGRLLFPVPLVDVVAIEQLARDVAVPPDGEVAAGGLDVADEIALGVPDALDARAADPAFAAGVARIDVEGDAAPRPFATVTAELRGLHGRFPP